METPIDLRQKTFAKLLARGRADQSQDQAGLLLELVYVIFHLI